MIFGNILSQKRDTNFTKLHIHTNYSISPAKNFATKFQDLTIPFGCNGARMDESTECFIILNKDA